TCACARASQELFIAHMKYISNRQNRWKINGFRIQRPPAAGPMSRDLCALEIACWLGPDTGGKADFWFIQTLGNEWMLTQRRTRGKLEIGKMSAGFIISSSRRAHVLLD
ncbi:MAG: hypothetical protein NTW21_09770, partial [Verrucomicrobia bacterium]|nr:hypothetical protein [Verrucomicrobiota bacterium]